VRILLDELMSLPTAVVREALGVALVVADDDPDEQPHRQQGLAHAVADGLVQLGYLVRRHPWLAAPLRDELLALTPCVVLAHPELQAVVATAQRLGGVATTARHSADPAAVATVFEMGSDTVRLVLTSRRPQPYPPTSGTPAAY
jgi:hypothetical protein